MVPLPEPEGPSMARTGGGSECVPVFVIRGLYPAPGRQAVESRDNSRLECAAGAFAPFLCFPLNRSLPRFVMKVLSSLKSAKARHRDCKVVRRRGKVFVICKSNPRFKARQR